MSGTNTISLAVWDTALPVVAGDVFEVKVGAKAADARALAGCSVVVSDASGAEVAAGTLGGTPWPGTEALYWLALSVPAPALPQVAAYRVVAKPDGADAAATAFAIIAARKPEHSITFRIVERGTSTPLADVEVRLGPFRARTDANGYAALRVDKGDYQLRLWRTAYLAEPQPLTVGGDTDLEVTMQHVAEEHPDARWVR